MRAHLALGLVLVGQGLGVAAMLSGRPLLFLVLHASTCALPVIALRCPVTEESLGLAVLRLLRPLLPALGPFAAATGVLVLVVAPLLRRGTRSDATWRSHLFPETGTDPVVRQVAALDRAAADRSTSRVAAFADILRWGSLEQQERVVVLMSREFRPGFAPLLREALSSMAPGLRAQAAAGLAMVEARFEAQGAKLRRAALSGEVTALLSLARHLDELANSGLLDLSRSAAVRAEAVGLYRTRLASQPDDSDVQAALGRDLMQVGRLDDAIVAMRTALARGLATPSLIGWLAECLYRRQEIGQVSQLIAEHEAVLRPAVQEGSPLAASFGLWLAASPDLEEAAS